MIYKYSFINLFNATYMPGSALGAGDDKCPTVAWRVPRVRHCALHNLTFTALWARYCFIPILRMRKLRHRLVKRRAQEHTATET